LGLFFVAAEAANTEKAKDDCRNGKERFIHNFCLPVGNAAEFKCGPLG
jgi:hypothetical protein